jgi:hypothetical protein
MSSVLQKYIIGGACATVAALAIFGMGEAQGGITAQAHPKVITITKVETKTVTVPGPTQTVTVNVLSPACAAYLKVSAQLLEQFKAFDLGYGGIRDQLTNAFDAIEVKDDAALTTARIKLANMDIAASDAASQILALTDEATADKSKCHEAK